MELRNYMEMFRRWAWLLILGLVLGAVAGLVVSLYQTPVYQASTRVLAVRASQSTSSDLTYLSDQQLAPTYVQLLTTEPVLEGASTQLGYPINVDQLSVQPVGTTQVIKLSVEDTDPQRSAAIANALVQSLIDQNENLQAGRYAITEESLQVQINQTQAQIVTLQTQVNQVSTETVEEQLSAIRAQIDPLQSEVADLQKEIASLMPSTAVSNKNGTCSCPTNEYQKLEKMEIQAGNGLIVLNLKPKTGLELHSAEIAKCLEYTQDKVEEKK